jgi:hypothetical protein
MDFRHLHGEVSDRELAILESALKKVILDCAL